MKKIRIDILHRIFFILFMPLACCKALSWEPAIIMEFPIYSGMWKNINILPPSDATLFRCRNCEIILRDTFWQLRPLSVGSCSIDFYRKNKKFFFSYCWDVIQVPDPNIQIGPAKPNHDSKDRENLFLNLNLSHIGDGIYTIPGEFYLYQQPPPYEVFSFTIKIYNEKNILLYAGENFSGSFSCDNADAFLRYKQSGNRIVIEDIIVFFPDNTHKKIFMDTILVK